MPIAGRSHSASGATPSRAAPSGATPSGAASAGAPPSALALHAAARSRRSGLIEGSVSLHQWLLIVLLIAVSAIALLGLRNAAQAVRQEAREQFYEQYNRQQLLLAGQAAQGVEAFFDRLRRSLGLMASLFEQDAIDAERVQALDGLLRKLSAGLADPAIIDMVVFDREGTVVSILPDDPYTLGRNYAWRDYFIWAQNQGQPGAMYLSPFYQLAGGQSRGDKAVIVAEGVYDAAGTFNGLVMFTVNFDELARRHILSVRLGEYGYAWLADINNQTILVDPNGRVAGLSFDEVIRPRWPRLYELLLESASGEPGYGWYDYEDPADPAQATRKLVGYQPIAIEGRTWTLGVATPEREVDALLSSFLDRQEAFSRTLTISILTGTLVISGLLLSWNRMLSRRVAHRTGELEAAQRQLQATFHELLTAKKMAAIGHLALGLAHEIRNPLSAIRMNFQMIRRRWKPDERLQEHFSIIDAEIMRLNRLLGEVMDFARPKPLLVSDCDLTTMAERLALLLKERLRQDGIDLQVRAQGRVSLLCDAEQIEQVVLNLLLNGMDALQERATGKQLTLAVEAGADQVLIDVCDNGSGIDPETLEHLFDPFFTTKPAGGGLGLSTVQAIVLRHRGSIDVDSQPGRGSCFRVRLPRAQQVENAQGGGA